MLVKARFYVLAASIFTSLLLACGAAHAGQIAEELAAEIAEATRSGADAMVSGLIVLPEQLDIAQLERTMADLRIQTRWRRHEFVIHEAQTLALRTQPPLLERLASASASGAVASYQSFWISNMIAVEARASFFQELATRADVATIHANAEIQLRLGWADDPTGDSGRAENLGSPAEGGPRALEDNLVCVNVQPAWDLGFTGATRLVCTFDTGADGNHPAFGPRWRGLDAGVTYDQAWRDPYNNTTFPYDSGIHGTHVLGIVCSAPPGLDPLGVAFESKWICAGILIGYNVQKIIDCYQWASDPDSNPSTIEDVPDVINNSWGTSGNCDQTYWNAMDVVEAAGIVNVIAVDNSGPGFASVNSPESRAATPYNTFSVGNVNPHDPAYPIATSSGRGPSPCDMTSIKPEVTAPGTSIRSTLPGGGYGNLTGTSMASPHVAGAATLLRQVNPSLTVEQVKEALMQTAVDKGDVGEDNAYGTGIINIGAAVDYVINTYPLAPSPRSLTGSLISEAVVQLRWQPPIGISGGNPLTGYNVYRASGLDPYPTEPTALLTFFPTFWNDGGLADGDYRYVVTATYQQGQESEPSNEFLITINVSAAVSELADGGAKWRLRIEPNPTTRGAELLFYAPESGAAALEVFDAAGKRVRRLLGGGWVGAGEHRIHWDGLDDGGHAVPAGTYFASLRRGAERITERVTVVR